MSEAFLHRFLFLTRPSWGAVVLLLSVGVSLVAFGNADRIFWQMTSHGARLPGLVLDVRSYRLPDSHLATYVPKVAFRDPDGKVRIMETRRGSVYYDLQPEQQVLVAWEPPAETVVIDVPFRREVGTSVVMSLFTSLGLTSWLGGIWLLIRRVTGRRIGSDPEGGPEQRA